MRFVKQVQWEFMTWHTHSARPLVLPCSILLLAYIYATDASFVVWTLTNHMKSNFYKMDWNHIRKVVLNGIWSDASQCGVLWPAVMSLFATPDSMRHQWAQLAVRSCNIMKQTELMETSSPWTEEEPHWLISVWGDSSFIQAKLKGFMHHKCRCLLRLC